MSWVARPKTKSECINWIMSLNEQKEVRQDEIEADEMSDLKYSRASLQHINTSDRWLEDTEE